MGGDTASLGNLNPNSASNIKIPEGICGGISTVQGVSTIQMTRRNPRLKMANVSANTSFARKARLIYMFCQILCFLKASVIYPSKTSTTTCSYRPFSRSFPSPNGWLLSGLALRTKRKKV